MPEHIRFTEHLISNRFTYAYGISTVDLTGNGSLDIIAGDTDSYSLYWFENDGHTNFTRHIVHYRQGEWIERHHVADLNGDGQPEVVCIDNIGGAVHYFTIEGDPHTSQSWRQRYIAPRGTLPGAYDVTVADFDGDGEMEVAASSWRKGNRFVIYKGQGDEWQPHIIEDNIGETRTVVAVDMNGDGRPDLLGTASAGNQVMWYENPGSLTQPWTKHIIDTISRPMHGHAVDIDGDGDVDVVMAVGLGSGNDPGNKGVQVICWYENLGTATEPGPWQRHIIANWPTGFEAVAADLDGDGQVEVVATGWGPQGRISLFKHDGDPRGTWSEQVLRDNWSNANTVFIADLDGDGRLDIVACAERGANEVRWWKNEGPAS
jgi:hypothetical protein